jgi:hypothetical protein
MSRYNMDDWMDWSEEDEELLEEEYEEGVVEYEYGIDEKYLKEKMAPKNVESPAEFSKTHVIKLQHLIDQKIEGLIVGLATPKEDPKAKFFYTIKYWWTGKDPKTQKTVKKLVGWEVRGPTSAYYIKIPTEHIIGIYRTKGYQMSSDIFVEYRIDEQKGNIIGKWIERRDAFATWKKPEENVEKEFRKIQEGKPSDIAGSQPIPEDKGPFGLGGLFQDIQKTLLLLIVLAIILGGIYFTAKLGILDIVKDVAKSKK